MTVRTHGLPPSAAKLLRAVVVRDVAAEGDPLLVRIESFGPAVSEAAAWPSIYPLPKVGDVALALVDETGVPWIQGFERKGTLETAAILTALPSAPFDGQIINFQSTAMAAEGQVWRLRYRAASASSHKWEFVGGSGIRTAALGDITTASVTFVALTSGPTITVPLAGTYEITLSIEMVNKSGAGNNMIAAVFLEAVEQVGTTIIAGKEETGGIVTAESTIAAAAGEVLNVRVRSANTGSSRYVNARLGMRPVRVG